jgi:hypothetical protein
MFSNTGKKIGRNLSDPHYTDKLFHLYYLINFINMMLIKKLFNLAVDH